jgi:dethiobiotin synthetase
VLHRVRPKITFVTGTDTGVGKTIFSALLIRALRTSGINALGMKPFCSGSLEDIQHLRTAQEFMLTEEEICPFFYRPALSPLASGLVVPDLDLVIDRISALAARAEHLVVEGMGGLMVPIGSDYMVLDIIRKLRCRVVLVARNQIGTINHTLLSYDRLQRVKRAPEAIVLMNPIRNDLSGKSNARMIERGVGAAKSVVLSLPFLGKKPLKHEVFQINAKKFQKTLAGWMLRTYFPARSLKKE